MPYIVGLVFWFYVSIDGGIGGFMGVYGGVMCVMVILNIVCVRFFMCLYLLVILYRMRCILFIVYICVIGGVVLLCCMVCLKNGM